MRYTISHRTTYEYNDAVSVSHHLVRLHPRDSAHQRTLSYRLMSDPVPAVVEPHSDYFGNLVSFITIEGPHRQLSVSSECEIEVSPRPLLDPGATPSWESVRDLCQGDAYSVCGEACEYYYPSALVPVRPEFLSTPPRRSAGPPGPGSRHRLDGEDSRDFKFDAQANTVATPVEQVLRQRRGVCQDFAQLQIACFRSMGLSARYVSGYLETAPPPAGRNSPVPTRRMPGSSSGAAQPGGLTWTRPTTFCLANGISLSLGDETSMMLALSAASWSARAVISSVWRSM